MASSPITSWQIDVETVADFILGGSKITAGIKIAGRDINNLRYADDTTLMAESEEELKSLLKKVPLIFASLITACLSVFLLGSILVGTLCAS